jgi:hypothetical protein
VVVGLACFEPGFRTIFEEGSPSFKNRFMFMAGYDDEARFDAFMRGFDLNRTSAMHRAACRRRSSVRTGTR